MKGVGRRIAQLVDNLIHRRRYWVLKGKLKIEKGGNESLSIEHKDEIQVIFHKSMDWLIRACLITVIIIIIIIIIIM